LLLTTLYLNIAKQILYLNIAINYFLPKKNMQQTINISENTSLNLKHEERPKELLKLNSALLIKVERADTNFGRYFVIYLRHKNKKYAFSIKKDYYSHNEFLLKEKLRLFDYVDVEYYDEDECDGGIPIFKTKEKIFLLKLIKTAETKGDEKIVVAAFDLETDVNEESEEFVFDIKNQILCISYCDSNKTSKVLYWAPEKLEEKYDENSFEYYNTERELILGFLKLVGEKMPDILVSHNGYNFDVIFLWARAMFLEVPLLFGPSDKGLYWREGYPQKKITSDEQSLRILKQITDKKTNNIKSPIIEYNYKAGIISYEDIAFIFKEFVDRGNIIYNIKSYYLLDTLLIARRELYYLLETFEIQNFKLDTLSKYFFKEGKDGVEGSKIGVYWRKGGEKLRELLLYNLQDSALNLKIAQLHLFVPYYCALSQKINDYPESISFYNARANTSLYKSLIRNKAIETNIRIPGNSKEKAQFAQSANEPNNDKIMSRKDFFNEAIGDADIKLKIEEIKTLRKEFADQMLKIGKYIC